MHRLDSYFVNCPREDRVVAVSYTDTVENWAKTESHCANILLNEVEHDGSITKTFAVWSESGVKDITFYRPSSVEYTSPTEIRLMMPNEYVRPENAQPLDCGINPPAMEHDVK